jgi:transcriptional regulator GlxA family with amidase domain
VLATTAGEPIVSDTGVTLATVSLKAAAAHPIDTLLVAGGDGVFAACGDRMLARWLAREAEKARRVGSTCMGTFMIAAAGLLTRRRATTHWRWCDELRRLYPDIEVEADAIFVKHGQVWSSAGVTAGIDMALAMVEEDHGRDLALDVAQSLVVFLKRPGGQSQFSTSLTAQVADRDGKFDSLHRWIAGNLAADLRVGHLAERMGMSPRTFARVYAERMRTTPAKAIENMRLEAARRLLEQTAAPLLEIARRSGFRDVERMRRAFERLLCVTPSDYRRRFTRA